MRWPADVGCTMTRKARTAVPPAARVPGFQVMLPVPPTAGCAVTVPWLTCAMPSYLSLAAGPGTLAVTRLVAEKVIAWAVGLTMRTVTVNTVSEPTTGGLGPLLPPDPQ